MKNLKLFIPLLVSILLLIIFKNIVVIIVFMFISIGTGIILINKVFHETFPEENQNQN